jgi:hypothetical protein
MIIPAATSFWYVATPYARFPGGMEAAHVVACRVTARLIVADVKCYSPIAHMHLVALRSAIDRTDHDFWMRADEPMMRAASGCLVVKLPSWAASRGIAHEVDVFATDGKPVLFLNPKTLEIEESIGMRRVWRGREPL